MKPAPQDYLPDVIESRRRADLRGLSLINAAIWAILGMLYAFLLGLCGLSTPMDVSLIYVLSGACALGAIVSLYKWWRLGKARP